MMKSSFGIPLILAILMLTTASCHERENYADDPYGNFDALWSTLDDRYCFFTEKGIDWRSTGERYRARIIPDITDRELFDICAEMVAGLKDGHCNLSAPFDVSYYRNWWSDYPQDFNMRTIEQYYLDFDYSTTGGMIYKILPQNIGYLYYPSFSVGIGEGNIDYVLSYLSVCDALILDIRDNGGGLLTNINKFVSRFIHEEFTGAYIRHKTGPGHDDFSEPYPVDYIPASGNRVVWNKPVALLTNRSCYSAANAFAAVMKEIEGVSVVGAKTGGGGGLPFSSDLPNGWRIRFSASPVSDAEGRSIESGVEPSEGCEIHAPAEELAAGRDAILDFAISLLSR